MKSSDNSLKGKNTVDISAKRKRKPSDLPHIDNRSFVALLIRGFLTFTLFVVIAVSLIFGFAYWMSRSDTVNIYVRTIENYRDELRSGRFSAIPVDAIFGKRGWLDIVNMSGEVVWSTSKEKRSYTLEELDCIIRHGSGESVRSLKFEENNSLYSYIIIKSYSDGTPDKYLFLDSDLKISAGTLPTTKTHYTQREYDLLVFNSSSNGDIMEKFEFEWGGENYFAVYLDSNEEDGTPTYIFVIIVASGVAILMAVVIIFYIRYINRHVQRPLKALGAAMSEFAKGDYRGNLTYRGTKEFEQLVEGFNEMVNLLNASEEQRKALEQDKQRMLAGLSHDLKTPMTVIQGFSKAMRDGLIKEEDKQKYLNLILTKSEHMSDLINEFYEYSKLDHPDFLLSKETLDVAELVRIYLAGRYDEFEISGRRLEADISEERLFADVDKAQFVRVLDNLVNNFFKYAGEGTTLFVDVTRASDGSGVQIFVGDDGSGISNDEAGDVFAPFVVGEKSRNNQGSGLGLAVCKKIIEAHGGSIELAKEPHEGRTTEFVIYLPGNVKPDEG